MMEQGQVHDTIMQFSDITSVDLAPALHGLQLGRMGPENSYETPDSIAELLGECSGKHQHDPSSGPRIPFGNLQ
jgi:hypothetical protein